MTAKTPPSSFADQLLAWHRQYGRHDLPWQHERNPYRVWVSEIMLQQTQVATVIPYYQRFMASFPTVAQLAEAPQDQVLHHWTGLGYYARARNLHKAAHIVHREMGGAFPDSIEGLCQLPGIGRSTAGAILALGSGRHGVILDGNVKRVLTRYHVIEGWPEQSAVLKRLWELAEQHTPREGCASYTQAIMDLGATLCSRSRPACALCPLAPGCLARRQGRQDEFPHRKPRKRLPVKAATMLLLKSRADNSVLLEKRPPSGIWGGLWSFPELPGPEAAEAFLAGHGLTDLAGRPEAWAPLRHTFSHYHLDITPLLIPVHQAPARVQEAGHWQWYSLDQPPSLGLAAPVKKLLALLGEPQPS